MKKASEIKVFSNLEIILAAMEKEAEKGYRSLNLYKMDMSPWHEYSKTFNYTQDDLNELENLGFKIRVGYTENVYKGFLFWKKKVKSIDYHYISW